MSQIDPQFSGQFDRMPPHDIAAEQCVIASMMLDSEMIERILQMLSRDEFFQADHQVIFELLGGMFAENKPIDMVGLHNELSKRNLLVEVGGASYLATILGSVPSAAHGEHYANIVHEKYLMRCLISSANETLRDVYAPHDNVRDVISRAEARFMGLNKEQAQTFTSSLEDALIEAYDEADPQHPKQGIDTGFLDLDHILNGLQNGEMIVVAARPSMGKSALCHDMIGHISTNLKIPCGIFTMEMSRRQIAARMLSSWARIDSQKIRKGMINAEECDKLQAAVVELSRTLVIVDDNPRPNLFEFRAGARRMYKAGARVILIDYMQLMDGGGKADSRTQEVGEISRGIKAVARELDIPIIAVSQLNRSLEGREGHKPRMSDLRESGSIEQDADVVLLLHREDYYKMTDPDFCPDNIGEIIIAKQRNGPVGVVKVLFNPRCSRFDNLASQIGLPYGI